MNSMSIRSAPAHIAIACPSAVYSQEFDVMSQQRPMLSTVDGDLWLLSTPHGKRGFFWEEWAEGGPEWTRVSVTAAECPRIRPEFLDGERRSMGEEWMRQEYFCEFADVDSGLFDRELLERAVDEDLRPLAA